MINMNRLVLTKKSVQQVLQAQIWNLKKMRREAKKVVDSVLVNSRSFYWKFSVLIRIISDDRMK